MATSALVLSVEGELTSIPTLITSFTLSSTSSEHLSTESVVWRHAPITTALGRQTGKLRLTGLSASSSRTV